MTASTRRNLAAAADAYHEHINRNRSLYVMGCPSDQDRIGALRAIAREHGLTMEELCPHVGVCAGNICAGHSPAARAALSLGAPKKTPSF
ncbi:hypothetical protein ABEB22_10675 [Thioclava sp. 'Guangxiensis']|uniref:hypothetical protein n=1 Tax=Thioclava sp. 'Guangxiensis' TaxID=3149044 RepID=UPI003878043D